MKTADVEPAYLEAQQPHDEPWRYAEWGLRESSEGVKESGPRPVVDDVGRFGPVRLHCVSRRGVSRSELDLQRLAVESGVVSVEMAGPARPGTSFAAVGGLKFARPVGAEDGNR